MNEIKRWNGARHERAPFKETYTLPTGTVVRARVDVWDDAQGPTPAFPRPHAFVGELGVVVDGYENLAPDERGAPTVTFSRGTTDVVPWEVEAYDFESLIGETASYGDFDHGRTFVEVGREVARQLEVEPGDAIYHIVSNELLAAAWRK